METVTEDSHPGWLDRSFLETALRSGQSDPRVKVTNCEVKRATVAGDNYLSEMYRAIVQIVRDGQSEESSLIVKAAPLREEVLKVVTNGNLFDIEVRALRDAIPAMHRLLEEVSPGKYQPFAAKYLYSHTGPPPVIVLEDLKKLGFKMAEKTLCLDLEHSLLVVKTLARYHATSLVLHEREPQLLKPYKDQDPDRVFLSNMDGLINSILSKLGKEIKEWPEYNERFGHKIQKLYEIGVEKWHSDRRRDDEDFNCLSHGDLWFNNLMFRYSDETGEVEDVRFVDYQIGYWTSPAIDLMYFLNSSTSVDIADKYHVLVEEYYKTLGEILSHFGLQSLHPTIEQFNRQLEKRTTLGVISALAVRVFILADPGNLPDFERAMKEEEGISFSDLYKEAVKKLLPVLEQRGWL